MNCIITGANVKILARTINFFSKIGNEMLVEALPTGLSLKVVNSMSTAYAVANFNMRYFISFRQGANDRFEENNCKVFIKPVLRVFKSLNTILICKIWLQVDRMKIIFQFKCKAHILKTHIISLLEYDHINALRLPESFPNKIVADHKVLNGILLYFHRWIDELTFDMKADEIIVSNYIENPEDDKKSMRSTYQIGSSVFRLYDLESPSKLTFCYKEFKAMAWYAGHNKVRVEMNFGQAGSPIIIRMRKDEVLHITLVMGTMRPRLEKQNRSVQRANRKITKHSRMDENVAPVPERDSERIDLYPTPSQRSSTSQVSSIQGTSSNIRENADSRIDLVPSMIAQPQPQMQGSDNRSIKSNKQQEKEGSFLQGLSLLSSQASTPAIHKPTQFPTSKTRDQQLNKPLSYEVVFAGDSNDPNSESQLSAQPTQCNKRRLPSQSFGVNLLPSQKRSNLEPFNTEAMFSEASQAVSARVNTVNIVETRNKPSQKRSSLEPVNIEASFSRKSQATSSPVSLVNIPETVRESPPQKRSNLKQFYTEDMFSGTSQAVSAPVGSVNIPETTRESNSQSSGPSLRPSQKRSNLEPFNTEAMFSETPQAESAPADEVNIPETQPESPETIADLKRRDEKMRHIFQMCFEVFDSQQYFGEVYAENSDPEDS
ncbi:cell cycle checkpoint control protein RAD9A [Topomyia yanbarensis]|uniref:cell cycle checkpoint control protein RAD9A n=1 Tax=Topomyia yanbarensis TaxID=2498891 RepID=UPI00273C372C|nr:cell cycle checkpoint control protein RAD9A [Topomyia yanbarensis]